MKQWIAARHQVATENPLETHLQPSIAQRCKRFPILKIKEFHR